MNHGLENRWLWAFASSASNETGAPRACSYCSTGRLIVRETGHVGRVRARSGCRWCRDRPGDAYGFSGLCRAKPSALEGREVDVHRPYRDRPSRNAVAVTPVARS
jgi:hypothetical protein